MDDLFRIFPDLPWPKVSTRPVEERVREIERKIGQVRQSVARRQIAFRQAREQVREVPRRMGEARSLPGTAGDEALRRIRDIATLHYGRLPPRTQMRDIGRALRHIVEIAEAAIGEVA